MPVFGSILAVIFLDERFQTFHVFGMLLILTGIVLVIRQKKQTPPTRPMEYDRTFKNKV
jgi:drug/metabolite transporter (DMT)-like permease